MRTKLEREIATLGLREPQIAYETTGAQLLAFVSFIEQRLARGEHCLFVPSVGWIREAAPSDLPIDRSGPTTALSRQEAPETIQAKVKKGW